MVDCGLTIGGTAECREIRLLVGAFGAVQIQQALVARQVHQALEQRPKPGRPTA